MKELGFYSSKLAVMSEKLPTPKLDCTWQKREKKLIKLFICIEVKNIILNNTTSIPSWTPCHLNMDNHGNRIIKTITSLVRQGKQLYSNKMHLKGITQMTCNRHMKLGIQYLKHHKWIIPNFHSPPPTLKECQRFHCTLAYHWDDCAYKKDWMIIIQQINL